MIKNKSNIFNDKNSRISQDTINLPVHVGLKKQAKCDKFLSHNVVHLALSGDYK
jgi:hypothetical protein